MNKTTEKKVEQLSISKLIHTMNNNKVCLPSFQRDFVWNPEQMAKLIESVVRHFPIGTLLFLKYDSNKDIGINSFVGSIPSSFEPEYYVIDGQQRMRTFLKILAPPKKFGANEPIEHNNRAYKIYLRVKTNTSKLHGPVDKPTFIIPKAIKSGEKDDFESQGKIGLIPIELILRESYVKKWIKIARKNITKKMMRQKLNNILRVAARIKSYRCPIEKVNMKLRPEDHSNMFRLLNEAGTDLTTFDLLVAQLNPKGINLRKLWVESNKLYKIFQDYNLDPIYILKVLLLIKQTQLGYKNPTCAKRDLKGIDQYYSTVNPEREFMSDWEKARKYTAKALDDIKVQYGACQKKYIPYTPMIVTLAAIKWWVDDYMNYHTKLKGSIQDKLEKWYWGAIFYNAYETGSDGVISKHYSALMEWLAFGKRRRRPSIISYFFNRGIVKKSLKDIESSADARYKAILCLPLINGAQDLYSHDFLSNKKLHDHHIYPKRSKEGKELSAEAVNNIVNRMLITGETNEAISKKSPKNYLEGVRGNILKRHFLFKDIVDNNLNFKEFIAAREKLIVERLCSLLG